MNDPAYECLTQAEPLSEVRFVHDYLQFVFWPHGLSVYVRLRVSTGGHFLSPTDAGFYDSICTLIGQKLVSVTRAEKVQLELLFSGGTALIVSLRPEDAVGPEIAMLSEANGASLMVERYDE
jgi:hypothetical protein